MRFSRNKKLIFLIFLFGLCFISLKLNFTFTYSSEDYICNPIKKHSKQYYAEIDNQIYPKIVPSYLNESINFDCLNKAAKKP